MRIALCLVAAALLGCGSDDPEAPDFSIEPPTVTVTLTLGQQVDIPVSITRQGDVAGTIVVSVTGLRAGITAGVARFPAGQDDATVELNIETSVTVGPIEDAELIGFVGDLERTAPIDLIVVAP